MTILSTFICNSSSKIILARQFTILSRKEIEEHSLIFNRSLNTDKDSTVIETDTNRYLYIHFEECYIVLITTKDSNIIEDMEVLKLTYRLISDICIGKISESSIVYNAFDIALGLDDIISLGMYDGVNMFQLKQYLTMDSAEEKEFKRLQKEREIAAAEQLKISMREIEKNRMLNKGVFGSDSVGSDTITLGASVSSSSILDDNKSSNIVNRTNSNNYSEGNDDEDYNSKKNLKGSESKNKNKSKKGVKSKGLALGKKKDNKRKESNEDEEGNLL